MQDKISSNKIRQVFLLAIIIILLGLIGYHLSNFLSATLGAIALYILLRNYHFNFTENKGWKPWLSAIFLMIVSAVIIITPVYFLVDALVSKVIHSQQYVGQLIKEAERIHSYIQSKTGYNILDSLQLQKIGEWATYYSSQLINTTLDLLASISTAYFMLYFMLVNGRKIERGINILVPLKKTNIDKIEDRFNKLVIANVIGIPVVALGQGLTVLVGYWVAGVSGALFLFALTCVASVIPIVGGAIVYIPVALMCFVDGNNFGAVAILVSGVVSAAVDNIFRFTFLKRLEDIHPLNSVLGIILGLKIFGFVGLIYGPIMISITILLIQIYYDEFSDRKDKILIKEDFNSVKSENLTF